MDIDQLRTFDRVVRDGSFTKASARLNVTQATVSMRVQALEAALGVQLFKRGRQIQLTDQGIGFLPYCRRMLGVLQEARETLRRAERGRLSVGSLSTMIMPLISEALLRFQRRNPIIDVVVREGRHNQIATMLHEQEVELAIMCWPNLDPILTSAEPLLIVREDAPLVAAPTLARKLGSSPSMTEILEKAPRYLHLGWWQIAPPTAMSFALNAPVQVELPTNPGKSLVEAGEGIGFFARSAVSSSLDTGHLVEIKPRDLEPLHRDIALVVRNMATLEETHMKEFASEVARECRTLGKILTDNLSG
ncbi:LysR family transcriptional regulator [uncultured Roseibium sp.]|uniref:LysR family transcriptional regulator n=1 Tax=uncultured Roseibium sp. TaxID=1936171 RepID=UPI0025974091|nr:LysR family transcriptional regulator [uncultured Roseibium sp.]